MIFDIPEFSLPREHLLLEGPQSYAGTVGPLGVEGRGDVVQVIDDVDRAFARTRATTTAAAGITTRGSERVRVLLGGGEHDVAVLRGLGRPRAVLLSERRRMLLPVLLLLLLLLLAEVRALWSSESATIAPGTNKSRTNTGEI